jgi:hypothetical protein
MILHGKIVDQVLTCISVYQTISDSAHLLGHLFSHNTLIPWMDSCATIFPSISPFPLLAIVSSLHCPFSVFSLALHVYESIQVTCFQEPQNHYCLFGSKNILLLKICNLSGEDHLVVEESGLL